MLRTTFHRLVAVLALMMLVPLLAAPASGAPAPAPASISGTILDLNGVPARHVEVSLNTPSASRLRPVLTDANGHYSITGVAPGDYTIRAGYSETDWILWYPYEA